MGQHGTDRVGARFGQEAGTEGGVGIGIETVVDAL